MKLNFATRSEARQHCWSLHLPLKAISNTGSGSRPWVVETSDIGFAEGRFYLLVDVQGFIKTNDGRAVNKANQSQASQFADKAPKGVKIKSVDLEGQFATIEPVPGISWPRLRLDEARYFIEVDQFGDAINKPVKAEKPVKAKRPKKPPVVEAKPDLDAELDGGTPQVAAEKAPRRWVTGESYVLVDRHGFTSANRHNNKIANAVDAKHNGIYTGKQNNVSLHLNILVPGVIPILHEGERKFFKERRAVPAPTKPAIEPAAPAVNSVNVAKQQFEAKTETLRKALSDATAAHDAKLGELRNASAAVHNAAAALSAHFANQ